MCKRDVGHMNTSVGGGRVARIPARENKTTTKEAERARETETTEHAGVRETENQNRSAVRPSPRMPNLRGSETPACSLLFICHS